MLNILCFRMDANMFLLISIGKITIKHFIIVVNYAFDVRHRCKFIVIRILLKVAGKRYLLRQHQRTSTEKRKGKRFFYIEKMIIIGGEIGEKIRKNANSLIKISLLQSLVAYKTSICTFDESTFHKNIQKLCVIIRLVIFVLVVRLFLFLHLFHSANSAKQKEIESNLAFSFVIVVHSSC